MDWYKRKRRLIKKELRPRCVTVKVMDYGIVESEFELQFRIYVQFLNSLILSAMQ